MTDDVRKPMNYNPKKFEAPQKTTTKIKYPTTSSSTDNPQASVAPKALLQAQGTKLSNIEKIIECSKQLCELDLNGQADEGEDPFPIANAVDEVLSILSVALSAAASEFQAIHKELEASRHE